MNDDIIYLSHRDAIESKVFYSNKLNEAPFVYKYYPRYQDESDLAYSRRPKISIPIASSIIDRICNILLSNIVVKSEDSIFNDILININKAYNLPDVVRRIVTETIITGQTLAILRPDYNTLWEIKTGEWLYEYGYMYSQNKNGIATPVLEKNQINIVYVPIDEFIFGEVEHGLGFDPSFKTKNIDRYMEDHEIGRSYIKRFDKLIINYNQLISLVDQVLQIFQNVWTTTASVDDPTRPISLTPGRINFLGPDETLEQVVKQVNTAPENEQLDKIIKHISNASQVPAELAGFRDTSQLPSGTALALMLSPLAELIERYEVILYNTIRNVYNKTIQYGARIHNNTPPTDVDLNSMYEVLISTNIYPETKEQEASKVIELFKLGLLTQEEARSLLSPTLSIDLDNASNQ